MLATLLESKAKKERSQAGVALSIGAHSVLIAAALYATAEARPEPSKSTEIVRPLYFPPAVHAAHSQALATNSGRARLSQLRFVPPSIDISVPTVEIPATLSRASDFKSGALFRPTVDGPAHGDSGGGDNTAFLADRVEKQVSLELGSKPPRYPETLRAAGVEGRVVALFIVSDRGLVEAGSIRIVRSDNPLFDDAVRSALGRMRFVPAEIGGKKVRQLVEMPFLFTLSR
jgi:periplasmic protein TonB